MADDPIRAPQFSQRRDKQQADMMTAVLEAIIPEFPGATVTLFVTYPENCPGLQSKLPGSRTNYISSAQREDMAAGMIEVLKRWGKL